MSEDPPRTIDRYEILSPIGEGGMAAVYHARFAAPGGATKQVALKLIHPHLSEEPELVRMFLDEMRVAMAMSHRNIVQTFDAGRYRDRYYLVMELMNRGSLSGVQEIPLDVAVLVAMEVCAGLGYAHTFRAEPVIHRDVSPANILLSDQGDVKLADFGVAKVRGRLSVTITGMVKGKLRYMAPEQARGEVDLRSDLFALGAVLYAMVAGVPLRPNPSLEQARYGVDRVEFPPGRAEAIPTGLQRLIARCLHRDPARRPGSAAELRELLAGELGPIQRALGTGGDPLTRLRGFLARRPPSAPEQEAAGSAQARRLADAVMQVALDVPTNPEQELALDERSTLDELAPPGAARGGPPATPEDARTGETSVSPIRRRRSVAAGAEPPPAPPGTAETSVYPVGARTPSRRLLLLSAVLLGAGLVTGAVLLATPPAPIARPSADASVAHAERATLAPATRPTARVPPDARHPGPDGVEARRGAADARADARWARDAAGPEPDMARAREPARPRRAPPGQGELDLNSSPWAQVYVDGRLAGETPLQGLKLRAGVHTIRLVNRERGLSAQLTVQIRGGRTTRRWIRLVAPLSP